MDNSINTQQESSTPSPTENAKSNKGWMVAAIVLVFCVAILGITEFLAYQEIAKKDNRITELTSQQNSATQKEDQTEHKEVETPADEKTEKPVDKEIEDDTTDKISVNLDELKEQVISDSGIPKDLIVIYDQSIMTQSSQKYIVVNMSYGSKKGSGQRGIYYKENNTSGKWKQIFSGHQILCSGLSSEQKTVLKGLVYCVENGGDMSMIGE